MKRIEAPNYTQIPNVIFDYWMDKLTPAEFKVLLCICRKTFGFHKSVDRISLKQIEKMTGLSRKGITSNLITLMDHDLITKHQSKAEDGDFSPNRYEIHVYSVGGGSVLSSPGVVYSVHQGSELSTPTKETLTKEKENKNTARGQFLTFGEEKNVKLTQDQYDNLLKKMKPAEREYWIETIDLEIGKQGENKFNAKYKSHYHVILSWKRMREEKGETIGKLKDTVESNKELAIQTKDNFSIMCQQRHCRIEVGPNYIEIIPISGPMPSTVIKFTEKGFKDQLNNALRKWRLL